MIVIVADDKETRGNPPGKNLKLFTAVNLLFAFQSSNAPPAIHNGLIILHNSTGWNFSDGNKKRRSFRHKKTDDRQHCRKKHLDKHQNKTLRAEKMASKNVNNSRGNVEKIKTASVRKRRPINK